MKNMASIAAVLVLACGLSAAAQESGFSREDVAKLARAGVSDDVILAKIEQEKAVFKLAADDIARLKADGVSDRVIQAMLGRPAPKVEPAAPRAAGDGNLVVRNTSHRDIKVTVNERDGIVDFSIRGGTDLKRNGALEFKVKAGEYRIAVEGSLSRHVATTPATLLVRGAEMEYLDLLTLTVDDAGGSNVMILHSVGKEVEGMRQQPSVYHSRRELYGPQTSMLPYVGRYVLIGAGVGAIIGHQSGHRTEGALIGAGAGLMLHYMSYRGW